jgi:hypothetical protein
VTYVYNYEQHGFIVASIDNPAAATNLEWANPEDTPIRLLYFQCTLVTDANVDDRMLQLVGFTAEDRISTSIAPGTQPPGKTRTYYFSPCILGIDGGDDLDAMWSPLAHELYLLPDDTLQTRISHIKAGDQLSDIHIRYRQELPSWLRG